MDQRSNPFAHSISLVNKIKHEDIDNLQALHKIVIDVHSTHHFLTLK